MLAVPLLRGDKMVFSAVYGSPFIRQGDVRRDATMDDFRRLAMLSQAFPQLDSAGIARLVADQLMAHDGLGAHVRDELGISQALSARPIQAAFASAASFAIGAAMPLLVTSLAPEASLISLVSGTSLVFLALLGGVAARAGGAPVTVGAMRVTIWGALAMGLTAGVGALFGAVA